MSFVIAHSKFSYFEIHSALQSASIEIRAADLLMIGFLIDSSSLNFKVVTIGVNYSYAGCSRGQSAATESSIDWYLIDH